MINILPPEIKQQLSYARRNTKLLRQLLVSFAVATLLAGLMWLSFWYVNKQTLDYQAALGHRQADREAYKDVELKVQTMQSNLGLIEKLLNEKTKYSALLDDLAATLPSGSYINHLSLTGNEKEPLELLITVDSFNKAAELRNSLIASARIKSADIQSVTEDKKTGSFNVVIIAAFEPGQAR